VITETILGLRFFNGDVDEVIDLISGKGGFLVAPSGACFARLTRDKAYREAMINADLAIPDSGAMVLLWKVFRGRTVKRISGWKYLRSLSSKFFAEKNAAVCWVVPNENARAKAAAWLNENNFAFSDTDFYVAPFYGALVEDADLVAKLNNRRPRHVVIGIGSGPQEKLGYYLREHLHYRPAIHCIGAALGFLTGDQVKIPAWADRSYLGWLVRLLCQPRIFAPRYLHAFRLPRLLLHYGEKLPPLRSRN